MKLVDALHKTDNRFIPVNCPFHGDTNASAGYKPSIQFFNCLGCGKRISGKNNIYKELGMTQEATTTVDQEEKDFDFDFLFTNEVPVITKPETIVQEHNEDVDNFLDSVFNEDDDSNNLNVEPVKQEDDPNIVTINNPNHPQMPLLKWLWERKLSFETFDRFHGFYVTERGKQVSGKTDLYNHIIFPFNFDNEGKPKSFIARNMGDGNRYFQGGKKTLFNTQCIEKYDAIFMVEGISDFLAMSEMGVENVVCCFGVEVTEKILYPLRNKTVYIMFDTDYAGYAGAKKAQEILRGLKSNAIIFEIPKTFGNDHSDKIDCGSAWAQYQDSFREWVSSVVTKYNSYDSGEVRKFIQGKLTPVVYIPTRLPDFDGILNGGLATGLHLFGGEPEAGKSTLMTYLTDVSVIQGYKTLVATYELPVQQVYSRVASRYTKSASWQDIEANPGLLSTSEIQAGQILEKLSNNLKVVADWDINNIYAAIANFDVLIVDYAQRMPVVGKDVDARTGLIYNINRLSDLCRNQNKVVILVSSLKREGYADLGKSVFKETGTFEYVAQSAHVLRRAGEGFATINTVKNTRGATDRVTYIKVDGKHQRVSQASYEDIVDANTGGS